MLRTAPGQHEVDSDCSVLVVEDDPAIRRLLKMVLEREACVVETAADGIEAVLKLGLADFNVIILDLMMPNLDGFAFIETLANHDPTRLRQVIVTSAASPAVIRDRMKGTPFSVLPKPFDLSQLVSLVRECMKAQQG